MLALILALFVNRTPEAVVVPESVIITPDFEAVWVPEGTVGPIVAAPFDAQIFEVTGG